LRREKALPRLVLEYATGAAALAEEIAAAGVPVITAEVGPPGESPYVREVDEDRAALTVLAEAGVPVAIGSGALGRADHLPLLAAEAVGHGLPADVAVRAITLTPAEILGVQDRVGSLEPGKLADVVVTSGDLLASRSRVLHVLSAGRTIHENR